MPNFIRMQPEEYSADTFAPSAFDIENSLSKNPKHVARFRRDPATGAIQSNATIYRWSDGSTTVAIGDEHFEVLSKGLAAPDAKNGKYQELQDAHYYAAAAHLSTSMMLTVGHVTEQYSVRPNRSEADDALKRLTDRLQAASQTSAGSNMMIRTLRDPELAKKEAELAEKERDRARRRRETQAARADGGGGGGGGRNWGGLSVGDLEGAGGGAGRRSGGPRKKGSGAPRAKRRRDEYDSDDDLPGDARRKDDYYDKEDDFIASSNDGSDDEGGRGGDDDDEEEILEDLDDDDEEEERAAPSRRTKRQKTAEIDDDADGDEDDDVPASRRNRRHIVDEDEE